MPAAFAAAGDLAAPGDRARAIGTLSGMFPLSTLLGLPIGALAAIVAGWRGSFVFILIVALVALVLVARLPSRRPAPEAATTGHLATLRRAVDDRRALGALLVAFLWLTATFGLFVYVGEFVHRSFGVPAEQAGLVYVVVGLVGVIATRRSARVMGRIGARGTVLAAIAVFVVAGFVLPLTAIALPLMLILFAVWAFGTWTGIPAMQFIVAGLSATARGTLLAFLTSAINFGAVVGPIVTGRVLEAGGFVWAGPWAASLGLITLVTAWALLPDAKDPALAEALPAEG
jgi:predicted MFS family arabinose efflux permease